MIQILLGLMALCVLFFLVVIIRDVNRFVTVEYRIPCRGLKKSCCFVMLSDLHNKQFGEHNSRLLEAVEECRPDGVLIAGDMLTSQVSGSFAPALETVSALAEKYPVYYANGNHEYRVKTDTERYEDRYERYAKQLRRAGVVLLENESVLLPETGIRIFGVEIDMDYYKKLRKSVMRFLTSIRCWDDPARMNITSCLPTIRIISRPMQAGERIWCFPGMCMAALCGCRCWEACFPRRCACSPDTMGACMRKERVKWYWAGGWEPTRCQYGYLTREN